jgi:hypothetical protein
MSFIVKKTFTLRNSMRGSPYLKSIVTASAKLIPGTLLFIEKPAPSLIRLGAVWVRGGYRSNTDMGQGIIESLQDS